jgi:hypothetical protein
MFHHDIQKGFKEMSNIPSVATGSPLVGFNVSGNRPHVYYLNSQSHVIELEWSGASWVGSDITQRAGADTVALSDRLVGFDVSDGRPHVYYLNSQRHVMELEWSGSSWAGSDITQRASA